MSEIRYDRLYNRHVIIAPERLRQREHFPDLKAKLTTLECPFCRGNEHWTPQEIFSLRTSQKDWLTRVIPNRTKALAIEAPHRYHEGNFGYWDGFGAHEIIIDSPLHYTSMRQWSSEETENWLKTLRSRIDDLQKDRRLIHFTIFKNEGMEAGGTVEHCHTQLIALPFLPKKVSDILEVQKSHYEIHQVALMESILIAEEEADERIVATSGDFIALCPYASTVPFEIMISSKRYVGEIDTISDHSIGELSRLLKTVLEKLEVQLGDFSCNILVSTPFLDTDQGSKEAYRMMVQILPKVYSIGGFELASDIPINPVSPERAAQLLRGDDHG